MSVFGLELLKFEIGVHVNKRFGVCSISIYIIYYKQCEISIIKFSQINFSTIFWLILCL